MPGYIWKFKEILSYGCIVTLYILGDFSEGWGSIDGFLPFKTFLKAKKVLSGPYVKILKAVIKLVF